MQDQAQIPDRRILEKKYELLLPEYKAVVEDIYTRLKEVLQKAGLHPTIKFRVKSFISFYKKKIKLLKKARSENKVRPLPLTDIIGIRLICPFIEDLSITEEVINKAFKIIEVERKGADYSFKEFGYESIHILIEIPENIKKQHHSIDVSCCEIQIRTILQDAWAEVEHELVYKAEFSPFDEPMKRKLAALNANLTLSDIIFQEIRDYQHKFNSEITKRRNDFYKNIESRIDLLDLKNNSKLPQVPSSIYEPRGSIDDMLLDALHSHNKQNFAHAIEIYSAILQIEERTSILAIIYKHRGMAFFSESLYDEAIADFEMTLKLDTSCYKAAYYVGVLYEVKNNYSKAIDFFNIALSINPYQFYGHFRRAQAYVHLDDYPAALADCENALKLDPDAIQVQELKDYIHKKIENGTLLL